MVEQGQITGSRQIIVVSGFTACNRRTRFISVPIARTLPAGAFSTAWMMYSVEPASSANWTTSTGHSGWTITLTPGYSALALAIWAGVKRLWTEQKPLQRIIRAL